MFDLIEVVKSRGSNFDVISHVETTFMPIDQVALVFAAELANGGSYEQVAARLTMPLDIAALLMTNNTFSDLIDAKLASAIYMPLDRVEHIKEVKAVATNRMKWTVNRSGELVQVDRNIKEVIDADKHLRELQGRDKKQDNNNIINIRFEGLKVEDLQDENAIDVDFRRIDEGHVLTEGELLGDKDHEDRKAKARSILAQRHIPKQSSDLPPRATIERLSSAKGEPIDAQREFFYETNSDAKPQNDSNEPYVRSTQNTGREAAEIAKTLARNNKAVYVPQTEKDILRRNTAAGSMQKKEVDNERAKRGYPGRREGDDVAGKVKDAIYIPETTKKVLTHEEYSKRLLKQAKLRRKLEEKGIKNDKDFILDEDS